MLKITICDDEPREIEIAKQNLQLYITSHPEMEAEISVYTSAIELLCQIEEHGGVDILLLDIYLPGILGIEAAQQLRRDKNNNCQIIFLTTSRDYAVEAFAVDAVHYLLKPYSFMDFCDAIDKAVKKAEKNTEHYVNIKSRGNVYMVNLKSLLYVEANGHSQFVYSTTEPVIELRMTMNEIYETLNGTSYDFYRMGAAYIVNLKKIRQLSAKEIVLNGGKHLKVPRGAFPELKKAHMRVLFKEVY